jgi:hypothetical protein
MKMQEVSSGTLVLTFRDKLRKFFFDLFSVFIDDLNEYPVVDNQDDIKGDVVGVRYSKSVKKIFKISVFPLVLCVIILDEIYLRIRWEVVTLYKKK